MLTGNILITGGTGTLGNAIVRTAQQAGWDCRFTIFSRSEHLQAGMRVRYPDCRYILGDIRDYERVQAAIAGHDTVIHAASMKRVPECEANPTECIATNVLGTANVLRACSVSRVKRCVAISTDKACQAITHYGASKLMLETLVRSADPEHCICSAVRYGNVVASNGSVIPLWRKQAAAGQPITITHPEMTRFWMSPGDAVALVLAGLQAAPNTITVGKPKALSIVQLAELIAPNAPQVVSGLRATEKMHEILVHEDEAACDHGNDVVIGKGGTTGMRYTSDCAKRLTPAEFRAMLREAEELEAAK